jgi:surface protein
MFIGYVLSILILCTTTGALGQGESEDRLFLAAVRNPEIVKVSTEPSGNGAVTIRFGTGPNLPDTSFLVKCIPANESAGCEYAVPQNETVTGVLPVKISSVSATVDTLDFTNIDTAYSCYVAVQGTGGKASSCQLVGKQGNVGRFFYIGSNGVTVKCPKAEIGSQGTVNGVTYTKVDETTLRSMAADMSRWSELPSVCTSGITDMSSLFSSSMVLQNPQYRSRIGDEDRAVSSPTSPCVGSQCTSSLSSFNEDISTWDTSSVVNMENMFVNCNQFNQSIGYWDTSSVTNMKRMFQLATSFNRDIGAWDTKSLVTISKMFTQATSFNQNIGRWNTSLVIDMSFAFCGASKFNGDISSWDTSQVVLFNNMFEYASAFNQNINTWNTRNAIDMSFMFSASSSFNQNLTSWDTSQVRYMNAMFSYTGTFNGDISTWNVGQVQNMIQTFNYAQKFNKDIGQWNISMVRDLSYTFAYATVFNQDLGSWNTKSVTEMEGTFFSAAAFNQNLTTWNVSNHVIVCQDFALMSNLTSENYPKFDRCALGYCTTGPTVPARFSPARQLAEQEFMTRYPYIITRNQTSNGTDYCNP